MGWWVSAALLLTKSLLKPGWKRNLDKVVVWMPVSYQCHSVWVQNIRTSGVHQAASAASEEEAMLAIAAASRALLHGPECCRMH